MNFPKKWHILFNNFEWIKVISGNLVSNWFSHDKCWISDIIKLFLFSAGVIKKNQYSTFVMAKSKAIMTNILCFSDKVEKMASDCEFDVHGISLAGYVIVNLEYCIFILIFFQLTKLVKKTLIINTFFSVWSSFIKSIKKI